MCTALHLRTYVNIYSSERSMNLPGYFFLRGKQKSMISSHAKPTLYKECNLKPPFSIYMLKGESHVSRNETRSLCNSR